MAFEETRSSPKRGLDLEPGQSCAMAAAAKRRRCLPLGKQSVSGTSSRETPSPFVNAVPRLTSDEIIARLFAESRHQLQQRRHGSLHTSLCPSASLAHVAASSQQQQSVFPRPSTSTTMDDNDVGNSIPANSSSLVQNLSTSMSASGSSSPIATNRDVPLLTLKQVGLVCERMLRERDQQLTDEYDKVLATRLHEQYDAFILFNRDQLHRLAGEEAASYVS